MAMGSVSPSKNVFNYLIFFWSLFTDVLCEEFVSRRSVTDDTTRPEFCGYSQGSHGVRLSVVG